MLTQALGRYEPVVRTVIRVAAYLAVGFSAMLLVGLLLIRFWLWPSLPQWQSEFLAKIEPQLSQQGLSLRIGAAQADWESWYRPRLQLQNVSLVRADGHSVMSVEQLQATLGPRSIAALLHWQPIFSEIRLNKPAALVERRASGEMVVAGFSVSGERADASALNWLLRQGRLRIDGGSLVWRDDKRNKSAELRDITFAMNNFGPRHAWALRATPPATMGEGFVLQGKFNHGLFDAPSAVRDWAGETFVQFDRVNLSELFSFVHLPEQTPLKVNAGQGALRAWISVRDTQIEDLTADLDLANASLQWGTTRRPMTLQQLSGRVETKLSAKKQDVVLTNIALRSAQLKEVVTIPAARLNIEQAAESGELSVALSAKVLDLSAAMWFSEHLPLPATWKKHLAELQPRGRFNDLKLSWRESSSEITGFSLDSRFDQLSLSAGKTRPGFSGLSGRLEAKESGGDLSLDSRAAVLHFPGVFEDPRIALDRLESQISWTAKNILTADGKTTLPNLAFNIKKLVLSNVDTAIDVAGKFEWPGQGAGIAALDGRVLRADPTKIHRYVPLEISADTRTWLKESLLASKPYSATFELHGPLDRFPFRDDPQSRFLVKAEAEAGSLRPAPNWPAITNIRANAVFDRQAFRINATGAKLNDLSFSTVTGKIDDVEAARPILVLDGSLSGDAQKLIDATNRSPLKADLDNVTVDMRARGNVNLALGLKLDLDNTDRSQVTGKIMLARGSVFRLSDAFPELSVQSAELTFDQDAVRSLDIQGQSLGGPIRVTNRPVQKGGNDLHVVIDGQATANGLQQWAEQSLGVSLKDTMSGMTRYSASVITKGESTQARIESSLEGLATNFFGPFKKRARDNWGLKIDVQRTASSTPGAYGRESWVITSNQQYVNAKINRSLSVRGETQIDLDSRDVAGQFKWLPAQPAVAKSAKAAATPRRAAVLQARLSRLWLEKAKKSDDTVDVESISDAIAEDWPVVDLAVDDFRIGDRAWGKLEVQAAPVAATRSWEILKFALTNPDGVLSGQGQWSMLKSPARGAPRSRTSMNVEMQLKNGGAYLVRSGYPNVVKDTSGKIEGKLFWPGSPIEFSGAALSGDLKLDLAQGQFLKAEPGISRLVGVLNLQSLPRRIKLDFRDVFSEGFTYEKISGDLQFTNGRVSTQNLRILGIQASVLLEGSADIKTETQDLRVLVLPEVNAGLASLGYAALVNPAVGLGAFIAQYILRNPVRELLSYEYRVTGSWTDPVVDSVKREMRSDTPEIRPLKK